MSARSPVWFGSFLLYLAPSNNNLWKAEAQGKKTKLSARFASPLADSFAGNLYAGKNLIGTIRCLPAYRPVGM
jgi:hypothetical protein